MEAFKIDLNIWTFLQRLSSYFKTSELKFHLI